MSSPSIYVNSFAVAMWLIAHGHYPTATLTDPANGKIRFVFPAAAQSAFDSYNVAKDALNRMVAGQTGGR
jgi:hypothetical protein